ncbi:hypothetical protein D3C73_1320950 [compost metagenome]
MIGGDIDADVKRLGKGRRPRCQQPGGLFHDRAGHGHDQSAVFGKRNEQIGAHQAFLGMVPAHQHLDPPALFTVRLHHRLEIRHELSRVQCALHLKGRGRRTFLDDMPDKTGDHTEKQ